MAIMQSVAGRTENLVALFAAFEKLEVHWQREIVRVLRHEKFVIGNRTPCNGVFDRLPLRAAIAKKFGWRERPVFRLVGHILTQVLATAAEDQASGGARSDEEARGVRNSQEQPR
jgi:hypothetical protein